MSNAKIVRLEAANQALALSFMKWQCRLRQIMMREHHGKPIDAIMPTMTLKGDTDSMGHIITMIAKRPQFSKTMEMQHMFRQTQDPAQRVEKALKFFSELYYQRAQEFDDQLNATFSPNSAGAEKMLKIGWCTLLFEQFNQRYVLPCRITLLSDHNPTREAVLAHNRLFNPKLHPDTIVLGFEPDWAEADADPMPPV